MNGDLIYREYDQDLSSAVLDKTFTVFDGSMELVWVMLKASVAITETVTVGFNSVTGSNYDTTLRTASLTSEQHFFWEPNVPVPFRDSDGVDLNCTKDNSTGHVYVTICLRRP